MWIFHNNERKYKIENNGCKLEEHVQVNNFLFRKTEMFKWIQLTGKYIGLD